MPSILAGAPDVSGRRSVPSLPHNGDHHVGCGGNADRIARHNALRDAIFSAAQSAALAPRREVSSLIPCSLSRPADVYLPSWKGAIQQP